MTAGAAIQWLPDPNESQPAKRFPSDWLASRDEAWVSAVERVTLDPYRGHFNALFGPRRQRPAPRCQPGRHDRAGPRARRLLRRRQGRDIPECARQARTIRRWGDEVPAYCSSDGLSNARTEAINMLMKKIKRVGHGFRNLDNYRLRLLLLAPVREPRGV